MEEATYCNHIIGLSIMIWCLLSLLSLRTPYKYEFTYNIDMPDVSRRTPPYIGLITHCSITQTLSRLRSTDEGGLALMEAGGCYICKSSNARSCSWYHNYEMISQIIFRELISWTLQKSSTRQPLINGLTLYVNNTQVFLTTKAWREQHQVSKDKFFLLEA